MALSTLIVKCVQFQWIELYYFVQPKKFVAALQRVAEQTYNNMFTMQQMRQLSKVRVIMLYLVGSFQNEFKCSESISLVD